MMIPAAGTYRFVFVNGSFDESGGKWLGAYFYIANVYQGPATDIPTHSEWDMGLLMVLLLAVGCANAGC